MSATQLTAAVSAADIASAGTANVSVNTAAPGGGTSAAATFNINNPTPGVASISSTVACCSLSSEPNRLRSVFFRVAPTPGMSSRGECSDLLARFCR